MCSEEGAATIVEYGIVFPLVVMIVLLLIVLGNMTYDKALLESAAERGALYASKVVADPNYGNEEIFPRKSNLNEIDEITMGDATFETKPYRYLFGLIDPPEVAIEGDIEDIVRKGQLMRSETVHADVKVRPGFSYKVVVTVNEEFEIPGMFSLLGVPPYATVSAHSEVYVNEPAEFIRNVDYASELVKKVADATGVTEMLNKLTAEKTDRDAHGKVSLG